MTKGARGGEGWKRSGWNRALCAFLLCKSCFIRDIDLCGVVWPQGERVIRAWEPGGHRSAEVAVLKFRGWHVCARCHRHKKNLRAILRSDSELMSLSDRILLLVACRPGVRVKRACAVGMARRGAQIGRLGAPCKAGGHFKSGGWDTPGFFLVLPATPCLFSAFWSRPPLTSAGRPPQKMRCTL